MQILRSACKILIACVHHDNHPCQYFHPPYTILFTDATESEARFVVILKKIKWAARLAVRSSHRCKLGEGWGVEMDVVYLGCSCLAGKYTL